MAIANPKTEIPGYVAGTWAIDPVHSDVSFTVRHMMVGKVRGALLEVRGHHPHGRRLRELVG